VCIFDAAPRENEAQEWFYLSVDSRINLNVDVNLASVTTSLPISEVERGLTARLKAAFEGFGRARRGR
jgi:hypothetical protein